MSDPMSPYMVERETHERIRTLLLNEMKQGATPDDAIAYVLEGLDDVARSAMAQHGVAAIAKSLVEEFVPGRGLDPDTL